MCSTYDFMIRASGEKGQETDIEIWNTSLKQMNVKINIEKSGIMVIEKTT